jgi:hypothetical protein
MSEGNDSVRQFAHALYVAKLVEGKSLDDIVRIANDNGYAFTVDEAARTFVDIYTSKGQLPEWLRKKLSEGARAAYYAD